jgi:hypothetical protein
MTRYWKALLALAFLAVATPAAADPPQKSVLTFHGLTGQASWFDFDDSGCVLTSVQVVANQNVSHSPEEPPSAETDQITVSYVVADFCTGAFRFGSGAGPGFIDGSLRGLVIEGNVPVFDTQVGATTVAVIVTLEPTGDVNHDPQTFNLTTPTTVTQIRLIGASTSAVPSGVVVLDGVDLVDGVGGASGTISQTNGGTITIFH